MLKRSSGEALVFKQALPKLRVPIEWFSGPERVHREALALRWLSELGISVPVLRFEDRDVHLIGMDAVPEPHENWKSMLLMGRLEMHHVDAFAHLLSDIHTRSAARRKEIAVQFDDRSFFETLRIEPYYLYAAEQVPMARDFLTRVVEQTRANRECLVHGDFSPKNVLVHNDQFVLLDHEVAHFGDPAFDVGFSLAHFLSKAHHLPKYRSHFERAALRFWMRYQHRVGEQKWARTLEERAVGSILACLLARVSGRSRLEYLNEAERSRQEKVVLLLMTAPPTTVPGLVSAFVRRL